MSNTNTSHTTGAAHTGNTSPLKGTLTKKTASPVPNDSGTEANDGFKRTLTTFDMVVYGFIMLVPLFPLAIYGNVFTKSVGWPALSWAIALVCILPTALAYGQLIRIWPSSGAVFVYCSRGMSALLGFFAGWMLLLQYFIYPDLMYLLAGHALNQYVPKVPVWGWALIILAVVTFISLRDLKTTITVNKIALVCELTIIVMFIGFAIHYLVTGGPLQHTPMPVTTKGFHFGGVMSAVGLCILSYLGFGSIATFTQEAKDPQNGPSHATVITVLGVGSVFIVTCIFAKLVDPSGALFQHDPINGFYALATLVGGKWFGILCAIVNALALGVFSSLSSVVSISRVIYIMGRKGAMPKKLGVLSKKTGAPQRATALIAVVSIIILFPLIPLGTNTITDVNNLGALSTYLLVDLCLIWYCWIKKNDRKSVWSMLIIPAFGSIAIAAVMISTGRVAQWVALAWAVIGIIIYEILTRALHHKINLG